jgi:hypothetical protein
VVYASSSSALATGSALYFDGTSLGVGTNTLTGFSGFRSLELANAGGNAISLVTGTGVIAQTISSNSNGLVYMGSRSNHSLVVTVNDTEAMRLTSSSLYTASGINVGIGLSNPTAKFDVNKTANDTISRTNAAGAFGDLFSLGAGLLMQQTASSPYGFALQASNAANSFQFPLLLNPSGGNVGIGTSSPAFKLDVLGSSTSGSGIVNTLRLQHGGTSGGDGAKILFTAGTSTDGAGIGSGGVALNSADLRFYTGGNTERMRVNAGAPILCFSGGNTSATGTGIAFPATQSASSDANTLDDYEEGTWTPSYTGFTIVGAVTVSGTYTKIGRLVRISGQISAATSISGGAGGGTYFSNLPFPPASTTDGYAAVTYAELSASTSMGSNLFAYGNIYAPTFTFGADRALLFTVVYQST